MNHHFSFSHFWVLCLLGSVVLAQGTVNYSWRYYRPGNTGIQGDYCEAIWIGPDGDPYIGGYTPFFEEGGFAKFVQSENRWINYSNVDYPVIGHPDITGTSRVTDIIQDSAGNLWMTTKRGVLKFNPAIGAASLVNYASASPAIANGSCGDLDIAPDGTLWFALYGFGGSLGGLVRYTPATNNWHYWTGGSNPQGGNGWPILVWAVSYVSVQPKPGGGYLVWCSSGNSSAIVAFDSATQLFTYYEFSYTVGSMLEMPGKDCVDDAGNLWMRRFAGFVGNEAIFTLDYRKPDGTWVTPPQPALPAVSPPIWAFRAFGDRQALLVDGNSRVLRFDGSNWNDLGIWREGAFSSDVNIDAAGNVWVCGIGGAAKRDAATGFWQRYRVTNTSQYDFFNEDLSIDPLTGNLYACANAGPGYGGMTMFDGTRWIGFNNAQYGLGFPWPFPTDNSRVVAFRPSNGRVVANPMYNGLHEWNGSSWTNLNGMSISIGLVEDSFGRLWSLGEYFSLQFYDGVSWTSVPNNGSWGNNIQVDPDMPGAVWVSTYFEVIRTDGVYRFSRDLTQFPELNPQSDIFTTVAAAPGGIAWLGSTRGMFRIDANSGTYQYFTSLGGISCMQARPLAVTPDGRLWFNLFDPSGSGPHGLAWFDGVNSGIFSAPRQGGPQWGGLPHAQIKDLEVYVLPNSNAYELWMSCASRGIAVLTVTHSPVAVEPGETTPLDFALEQNYPNPFNPSTTIPFSLPQTAAVSLKIFDLQGRLVQTLVEGTLPAGSQTIQWNGMNAEGKPVSSGVYFYQLKAAGQVLTRKMMLLR